MIVVLYLRQDVQVFTVAESHEYPVSLLGGLRGLVERFQLVKSGLGGVHHDRLVDGASHLARDGGRAVDVVLEDSPGVVTHLLVPVDGAVVVEQAAALRRVRRVVGGGGGRQDVHGRVADLGQQWLEHGQAEPVVLVR